MEPAGVDASLSGSTELKKSGGEQGNNSPSLTRSHDSGDESYDKGARGKKGMVSNLLDKFFGNKEQQDLLQDSSSVLLAEHPNITLKYSIIDQLCSYLEESCLEVEGLFRVSGTTTTVREIWLSFAGDNAILPPPADGAHNVTNALKLYIREQAEEPLIPFEKYQYFIDSQKADDPNAFLLQVLATIPAANLQMLQRVIRLLVRVSEKHTINKMTDVNLAIVMGPTLIRPRPSDPPAADYMSAMRNACEVVLSMLQNYNIFFPDAEASPSVIRVRPMTVTPRVITKRRKTMTQKVATRPLRPRDFDIRPFINKKLVTQVPPSDFEAVENLLLVQLVEHNDVLTWTPHAQTPFNLSPYYIVMTPRFFHFVDAVTFKVKETLPIKNVKSMAVDMLHKGLFSIYDGEARKDWMFLSHNDKTTLNIVDMIRKNQAMTITGRKTVQLFAPKKCPILLEGGESEESQRALGMMFQTLHKAGYNEQDILDGSADLFEIVKRYKDILTYRGGPKYVIEFLFPPNNPDFMGIYRKSYKLDRRTPIATILRLLCAKARPGGVDTSQYVLCTLRGRALLESENLASYGLGALFTSWQLRVLHKSHALVISGSVVDFSLPTTEDFRGVTRKTVRVDSSSTVRQALLLLFRHLRLPLAPHKFEAVAEDGKVLVDTAPLSEYGLGLKFMTMRAAVVPRKFPKVGSSPEQDTSLVRSILDDLFNTIVTTKQSEKKRVKEQYCRDMVSYVIAKATYEISRASFLPLRIESLGRANREKIHNLLIKLENSELQRVNLLGYHAFVKSVRATAGQSHLPQAKYMTPAELKAFEEAEKEAEKLQRVHSQRQQQQQAATAGLFPPPPPPIAAAPPPPPTAVAPPPPPPGLGKGAKPLAPTAKKTAPVTPATTSQPKAKPDATSDKKPPAPLGASGGIDLSSSNLFKKKAAEKSLYKTPPVERRATASSSSSEQINNNNNNNTPASGTADGEAGPAVLRKATGPSAPPNFARPPGKSFSTATGKPPANLAERKKTGPSAVAAPATPTAAAAPAPAAPAPTTEEKKAEEPSSSSSSPPPAAAAAAAEEKKAEEPSSSPPPAAAAADDAVDSAATTEEPVAVPQAHDANES